MPVPINTIMRLVVETIVMAYVVQALLPFKLSGIPMHTYNCAWAIVLLIRLERARLSLPTPPSHP